MPVMRSLRRRSPFALVLATLLGPGAALAQSPQPSSNASNHIGGARVDVHANLGGYGSFGAGFRVDIPLLREGFIQNTDDELALSVGLDGYFVNFYRDYYDGGAYLIPSVLAQWNFYIGDQWSVFPEAGLSLWVGDADYLRRGRGFYAAPNFGIGARYHFSQRNAVLVRINTPTGFQLGLTF